MAQGAQQVQVAAHQAQPTLQTVAKVSAAGIGAGIGSGVGNWIGVIIVWLITTYLIDIPKEVQQAVAGLISVAVAWFLAHRVGWQTPPGAGETIAEVGGQRTSALVQ